MAQKPHLKSCFPQNKSSFNQIHYVKKSSALTQCLEEDLPTREKSFQSPSSHSRNSNKICQPELACTTYNWGTYSLNPGGFRKGNIETNRLTDQKKVEKNECSSENIECNELFRPEESVCRIKSVCSDPAIWDWDCGSSDDNVNPSAQNISSKNDILKQTIGLQSEEDYHSLYEPSCMYICEKPYIPKDCKRESSIESNAESDCKTVVAEGFRSSPRFLNASVNFVPPIVTEVQIPTAALCATTAMCPSFNDHPIHILSQIPGFTPALNPTQSASLICIKPFTPVPVIPANKSEKIGIEKEMRSPPIKPYPTITFACEHISPEEPKELNSSYNLIPIFSSKYILEKFSALYKLRSFQVPLAKESTSFSPNGQCEPKVEEIRTSGFMSAEKDDCLDSNSQSEVQGEDVYKKVGQILLTGLKHSCLPKGFIYNEPTKVTPTLKNCCRCRKSPEKAGKGKKPTSISWEDEENLDSNDEQGLKNKEKVLIEKTIPIGKIFPTNSNTFSINPCFLESCNFPKTPCTSPVPNMNRRIEFTENLLHQGSSENLTIDGDETIPPFLKLPNKDCQLLETIPDSKTQSEFSFKGKNFGSRNEIIAYPCTHSHAYSINVCRPCSCQSESARSRSSNLSRCSSPRSKKTRIGSADEVTAKTMEISASVQLIPVTIQDGSSENLPECCCVCPSRKKGFGVSTRPTRSHGYQYVEESRILPTVDKTLAQIQPYQGNQQQSIPCIISTNFADTRPCNDVNGFSGFNSGMLPSKSLMQQAQLQQTQFQLAQLQQAQLEKGRSQKLQLGQSHVTNPWLEKGRCQQPQLGQPQGTNSWLDKGLCQQPQLGQPQGTNPWLEKGVSQQPQLGQPQGINSWLQSTLPGIQDNRHSQVYFGSPMEQIRSKTIRTLYPQSSKVNIGVPQPQRCHPSPKRHKIRRSNSPQSHRMLPQSPQTTPIGYGLEQSPQIGKSALLGQFEEARVENNVQQCPSNSFPDYKNVRHVKHVGPNNASPVGKFQAEGHRLGKCIRRATHHNGNLISQNHPIDNFTQPTAQIGSVDPYAAQMGNLTSQAIIMGGSMPQFSPTGQRISKSNALGNVPPNEDDMNFNSQAYKSDFPHNSTFVPGPNKYICYCCKRPLELGLQNSEPNQLFQQLTPGYSQPIHQSTSAQTEIEHNSKGVQVSLTKAPSYNRYMESTMNHLSRPFSSKRRFDGCRRSQNNCSVLILPVCCNNLELQEPDNCCESVTNKNNNCCDCSVRNCVVVKSCNQPKNKIHSSICNSMMSGSVAYEKLPSSSQCCDPHTQPGMNSYQSSSLRSGSRVCSGSFNSSKRSLYNTSAVSKPFILTFPTTNCQQEETRAVGYMQSLCPNGGSNMGYNN